MDRIYRHLFSSFFFLIFPVFSFFLKRLFELLLTLFSRLPRGGCPKRNKQASKQARKEKTKYEKKKKNKNKNKNKRQRRREERREKTEVRQPSHRGHQPGDSGTKDLTHPPPTKNDSQPDHHQNVHHSTGKSDD